MSVTSDEVAQVLEGAADRTTELRVAAAALRDPVLRGHLQRQRAAQQSGRVLEPLPEAALDALRDRMRTSLFRIAGPVEADEAPEAPVAGWSARERISRWLGKLVEPLTGALDFPALAPALAAAPDEYAAPSLSFASEHSRLFVQQLPGTPARLRFLVERLQPTETQDSVAILIGEGGAVVVPLNAEGKGWVDVPVALLAAETAQAEGSVPRVTGVVSLADASR